MKQPGRIEIYEAAERFSDSALRKDDSLFSPGNAIWSRDTVEDVYRRFNLQPDETGRSFTQKLQDQLQSAPPETYQLFGELVFIAHLVVADIKGGTKRRLIEEILGWSPAPVKIPTDLSSTLDEGLAATSLAFKTLRPFQLWFLVEFIRKWKGLSQEEREAALADPWKMKAILYDTPIDKGYAMREALKHLLFPDVFEDIVSREHKRAIAAAFADLVEEPTDDVDRQLLQIREKLTEQEGRPIHFYDPRYRAIWSPDSGDPERWDELFLWGKLLFGRDDFDANERDYKLEIAKHLQEARDLLLAEDPSWVEAFRQGMEHPANNLVNWRVLQPFMAWVKEKQSEAETAFRGLWEESKGFTGRLNTLMESMPDQFLSASHFSILSLLLMALSPWQCPPFRATPLKKGYELTGYPPQGPATDFARRYRHALNFLELMKEEGKRRGVELRDVLDAQSLLWWLTSADPPGDWTEDQKRAFLSWREGRESVEQAPVVTTPAPDTAPALGLDTLANSLYVPEEFITDTIELLRDKGQVVFYGPPGTGKTYIARRLVEYLSTDHSQWEIVQFHPSYSYEDFVQGYRPANKDGQLIYELKAGPLMRLAMRAAATPDREFYLLIDEINRGNLPKIFGELLYLLEYRGDEVTLMYEDEERFVLPPNLFVIGTMNTADRSIGLVDAALRRRFHFIGLFPSDDPLVGLLGRWLEDHHPEMLDVAGIVDRLNVKVQSKLGRHLQIGHSHFMKKELSEEVLARIWEHDIMPLLEDQFYGHEKELDQFSLKSLRRRTDANDSAEGVPADADEPLTD